jgi:hypothetical protein
MKLFNKECVLAVDIKDLEFLENVLKDAVSVSKGTVIYGVVPLELVLEDGTCYDCTSREEALVKYFRPELIGNENIKNNKSLKDMFDKLVDDLGEDSTIEHMSLNRTDYVKRIGNLSVAVQEYKIREDETEYMIHIRPAREEGFTARTSEMYRYLDMDEDYGVTYVSKEDCVEAGKRILIRLFKKGFVKVGNV